MKTFDPKLREAMAEIKGVLKAYDIGGIVALQSTTHTEFDMHLEPSWSLIRFIREKTAVHVKIHHSKQPMLDQTCGMIYSFRDLVALFFSQLDSIANLIEQHSKVLHPKFSTDMIKNDERE